LNEAERFLVSKWDEARSLELAMEGVRSKYKELFQRVVDSVSEAHPELDAKQMYPTQLWTSAGSIGFGRKSWPAPDPSWPPGFWLWSLRLEDMASDDAEQPYSTIYVSPKSAKQCGLDVAGARERLFAAAHEVLTADELQNTEKGDTNYFLLYLPAPSKDDLLRSLSDGDGEKFVQHFVNTFDLMARFIPLMDKLFQDAPAAK
jgi:hypothetical protein